MEWFDMSKEPDDGQLCVVFDGDNPTLSVWPAKYDKANKSFTAGIAGAAGWFQYDEVSMWMPLPPPPDED